MPTISYAASPMKGIKMADDLAKIRLDTKEIVIGYVMSRLDRQYLAAMKCKSWEMAYQRAAKALKVRATSIKNLRDEFDPFHPNGRKGWHQREMREDRQRVLDELRDVSDPGLLELARRILKRDQEPILEAIDTLANVTRVVHNVAERLLTGRKAEDYFLQHSQEVVQVPAESLLDFRLAARGFDFGVRDRPEQAIEVKGLKEKRGEILFSDREWTEAAHRRTDYWLVVVGNLKAQPVPYVVRDPCSVLKGKSEYRTSVTVAWRCKVRVV